jgi:hypothetical protein
VIFIAVMALITESAQWLLHKKGAEKCGRGNVFPRKMWADVYVSP